LRSNRARAALIGGTIAVAVVLFVVLNGNDSNNDKGSGATRTATAPSGGTGQKGATPAPPPAITVRNAKPVGGIRKLDFGKGERVRFVVRSDTADEVHVHGYDLKKDVPAGGSVRFSFPASIDGAFEVELENHAEQIAELRVKP
jgi:hypothetical protein